MYLWKTRCRPKNVQGDKGAHPKGCNGQLNILCWWRRSARENHTMFRE